MYIHIYCIYNILYIIYIIIHIWCVCVYVSKKHII